MICHTWFHAAHRLSWRNSFETMRLHCRTLSASRCWRHLLHVQYESAHHGKQMAKRTDFSPDAPLSAEQLVELRQQYAKLSTSSLQQAYREALERCKLDRRWRAPASSHIQVLVQAWRQLRKAH
jgi:hypothetical protein